MSRRRQHDIRREHDIIPNVDVRIIDEREVEIRVDVMAEMEIMPAEIRMQRRLDIAPLADLGKHLLHDALALLEFLRPRRIVIVHFFEARELQLLNIRIRRIVDFTCFLLVEL